MLTYFYISIIIVGCHSPSLCRPLLAQAPTLKAKQLLHRKRRVIFSQTVNRLDFSIFYPSILKRVDDPGFRGERTGNRFVNIEEMLKIHTAKIKDLIKRLFKFCGQPVECRRSFGKSMKQDMVYGRNKALAKTKTFLRHYYLFQTLDMAQGPKYGSSDEDLTTD